VSLVDRCPDCGHFQPCLCDARREAMNENRMIVDTVDDVIEIEDFRPAVDQEQKEPDKLDEIFGRQTALMNLLIMNDKLPEAPVDVTSKAGQRQIKELIWAMVEEMAEASFILKNRTHRFTDHTDVDYAHFREELADALAYFIEICIFAGIGPGDLFREYCAKNAIVRKRVKDGY
jgi:NTP pyrophosphatase (non-canonical NTP hydrolase)